MTTELLLLAVAVLVAVGIPLSIMARTARRNAILMQRADQHRRYEAFNAVLARIEAKGVGPAQKIAAVRQLREFPEYRHITVVMCNSINVNGTGPGAEIFQNELKLTEEHLLKAEG